LLLLLLLQRLLLRDRAPRALALSSGLPRGHVWVPIGRSSSQFASDCTTAGRHLLLKLDIQLQVW
jgi:hypothetical protein